MNPKKHKIINKGFSLIELLAIIFIIGLVVGIGSYYILKTINNSKNTSDKLAMNNILKAASIYSQEEPNEIIWNTSQKNSKESFSCISMQALVNKGYLKENDLINIEYSNYIILTKDENETILNEKLDKEGTCEKISNEIKSPIPTAKEYCKNNIYNPSSTIDNPSILTKDLDENSKFEFSNNTGINAGTYEVIAKLKEGYIWVDNTTEDKTITCPIKKETPTITLNFYGTNGLSVETIPVEITSNVNGIISLKTSNKDYVTATMANNTISKDIKTNIDIKILAIRNTTTYITITLTPTGEDAKNYYTSSVIYTIGNMAKKEVPVPTCKPNLTYNASEQTLIEPSGGIILINNKATDPNKYTVTAKLKYGYIWKTTKSTEDQFITCSIAQATPTVTYDSNGGSACNPTSKTVTYKEQYGTLCTPSRTGYTFLGWYNYSYKDSPLNYYADTYKDLYNALKYDENLLYYHWKNYGISEGRRVSQYLSTDLVNTVQNHTLYAGWIANRYTLKYDSNGGSECSDKTIIYGQPYGTLCTPSRGGHIFRGWYTAASGGSQVTSNTVADGNKTVYAHWDKIACSVNYDGTPGNNGWYKRYGNVSLSYSGITAAEIAAKGLSTTANSTNGANPISIKTDTKGTTYYGYVQATNGQSVTCSQLIKIDSQPPFICKFKEYNNEYQRFYLKTINNLTAGAPEDGPYVARWGFGIKDTNQLASITINQYGPKGGLRQTATASRLGLQVSDEGIWWVANATAYTITITDVAGNSTSYSKTGLNPSSGNPEYHTKNDIGMTADRVCH